MISSCKMFDKIFPFLICRGTATCFAFGQTGAGKTYTLLGSKGVPGMYRLAGHDIFEVIRHQKTQNTGSRKFSLWISYFEIYCGQLFDLLNKRKKYVSASFFVIYSSSLLKRCLDCIFFTIAHWGHCYTDLILILPNYLDYMFGRMASRRCALVD